MPALAQGSADIDKLIRVVKAPAYERQIMEQSLHIAALALKKRENGSADVSVSFHGRTIATRNAGLQKICKVLQHMVGKWVKFLFGLAYDQSGNTLFAVEEMGIQKFRCVLLGGHVLDKVSVFRL